MTPKVRELRLDHELTIAQLAKKASVSRQLIHGVDRGYVPIKHSVRASIARALGVTEAELFGSDID